jgi:hypothetical protein
MRVAHRGSCASPDAIFGSHRWPYALALVDAAVAAVIIAALALTVLIGVQTFDALALHGGGNKPVLGLDALFDGLAARPSSAEHWWIYALLLSTMIPSLVNLVIGGTSLVRGLPGVPSLLLRWMPERGGVLRWNRPIIATVLTALHIAGWHGELDGPNRVSLSPLFVAGHGKTTQRLYQVLTNSTTTHESVRVRRFRAYAAVLEYLQHFSPDGIGRS